jgi:hypothetical protein
VDAKTHLIDYLQGKYGQLMTSKQLAKEMPVSAKQQSVLRQEASFPIPHKRIGKNVYYSIYSVSDYLLSDSPPEEPKKQVPQEVEIRVRAKKNTDSRIENLSHIFNMRGFVSSLEHQRDNIEMLISFFKRKIQHDELRAELTINPATKKIGKV